jgi:hypothetical protein
MLNRITPIYPEYIGLFPEAAELIERFRLSPDELKIGISAFIPNTARVRAGGEEAERGTRH